MNDNDNALDPVPPNIPAENQPVNVEDIDLISPDRSSPLIIDTSKPEPTVEHSQESTRARIAVLFTHFFLFIITVAFLAPFLVSLIDATLVPNPLDMSKNLVTEIASVLAGPFGFIVGFYFKQGNR